MEKRVELGQVVRSLAGRDRGQAYVVVGEVGGRRVAVADGGRRRVSRPKTKSLRHLEPLAALAAGVADRLRGGAGVTDDELRAALAGLVPRGEEPAAGAAAPDDRKKVDDGA